MVFVTDTPKSEEFITSLAMRGRDADRRKNDGILDRFLNSPRYRASQMEHGWTEELCAKHNALAQEDRSYTHTAREHQRLVSTWTVHLNSSGKTGQCQSDLIMQQLCESKTVCMKSHVKRMGEFIPVSRQQRSHNPLLETSQGSARLDPKTGWEWYSNPSPWTTSEFWRALSSWDE